MNKYYIGYQLPEHVREAIRELYQHILGNCELQPIEQLHVTALHLGQMEHERAVRIFESAPKRTTSIVVALGTYDRFGDHLVIKLHDNPNLTSIHYELQRVKEINRGMSWKYNPHITLAHGKKAFIRKACPVLEFVLMGLTLFQKAPGGQYAPYAVTLFE